MSSSKIIGITLIIFALFSLWLYSKGALKPVYNAIVTAPPNGKGIATFVVAFIVYLVVLSQLSTETGYALTVVLILGALIVNQGKLGKNSVIPTILGSTQ